MIFLHRIGLLGGYPSTQYLLDLYSGAEAAYSLRVLSSSFASSAVVRVRRSSDNAEADFTATEITDGTLTTWTGANDGFVVTWYDQSGNTNDVSQSTASQQPQLVASGVVVTGGIDFDNSDDFLIGPDLSIGTGPRSVFAVARPDTVGVNADIIVQLRETSTTGGGWAITPEVAIRTNLRTWVSSTPMSTGALNLNSSIYTSGNLHAGSDMWLNGASVTRTSGTDGALATATGGIIVGAATSGSVNPFDGIISEVVVYLTDQTSNRTGIEANIANAYGITL
jgi:hypothetical protein